MLKKRLILISFLPFAKISKAQEETTLQKPFKKVDIDAGFLFFPLKNADFITGWNIYTDIFPKWAIGLNGFVPIQLVFPIEIYSQPYLIAGIFARYKT